jgi:hypothetical protein
MPQCVHRPALNEVKIAPAFIVRHPGPFVANEQDVRPRVMFMTASNLSCAASAGIAVVIIVLLEGLGATWMLKTRRPPSLPAELSC